MNEPVLCYVDGPWAYFTTQKLKDQWGDDWNDAPYEHNAGTPYEWYHGDDSKEPWKIIKVAFEGDFHEPCSGCTNSSFSVEDINSGAIPWLRSAPWADKKVSIPAGTTLKDFCDSVKSAGGAVYLKQEDIS